MSKITRSPPASPGPQYLSAEHVAAEMADHGTRRLSVLQILVLAMLADGFVTAGALFSVLLAVGIGSPGTQRLVEGLGFSAGFFFVILSDAVLFTEANVVLPATILRCHGSPAAAGRVRTARWPVPGAGQEATQRPSPPWQGPCPSCGGGEPWAMITGRSWTRRCRTWTSSTRSHGTPGGPGRILRTWCRKPTCGPMPRSAPTGAGTRGHGWPRSA